MNSLLIDKTQDGYVLTYIDGVGIKIGHELIGASSEPELIDILKGEGVPDDKISRALAALQRNQRSTTISFQPSHVR